MQEAFLVNYRHSDQGKDAPMKVAEKMLYLHSVLPVIVVVSYNVLLVTLLRALSGSLSMWRPSCVVPRPAWHRARDSQQQEANVKYSRMLLEVQFNNTLYCPNMKVKFIQHFIPWHLCHHNVIGG